MQEETFRELERGATLITASHRLARALRDAFHARQRELGRSVWNRPDILALDSFLDRAWRGWLWSGGGASPVLLQPLQEQMVWETVIRGSPAGDSLLQIPETARRAMDAWRLVQGYRLPVDGRFEASDDCAAFHGWSRDFESRCASNRWLEWARLCDLVAGRMAVGVIPRPDAVYRAGFDEMTPQQADCFAAMGNPPEIEIPGFEPAVDRRSLADATEEIRNAALWARSLLERDPETQIGVIVPNLRQLRSKVQRIFRAVLNPSGEFDDPERSFHISLGPALDDYPLVHAALLMIEFGLAGLTLPRAGMLLRSPFLAGADDEWSNRALLDAKLRRKGLWDLSASNLRNTADSCPRLRESLRRFEIEIEKLSGGRAASEWARHFSKLLEALGWPGERPLTRREYQVVREWRGLLSDFAMLDRVAPLMTFDEAFWRLREAAGSTVFQVENEGANVQIMGMFEASGLRFDHVWIMGLDDETLPAPANPNPFLPLALQQEHGLPHSSPERELTFATDLIERLLASAPDVVFSHPEQDGDRLLAPSPLLPGDWRSAAAVSEANGAMPSEKWIADMRSSVQFEELADEFAPLVVPASTHAGGASLFKDMAACPFRAFAKHRLGAKPLDESTLGLSYRDRGTGVHKALELIWSELGSHTRLIEMDDGNLRGLVASSVAAAMAGLPGGIGRKLERRRLEKLLIEWLAIEKTRDPFVVRKPEQERLVAIGELQVRTRADRIDELPDGREIILDYKTGQIKSSAWDTERPDEPQLPLYCATSDRPVGGAAIAVIRVGELAFRGLTGAGISLPAMKDMKMSAPVAFGRQVAAWKQALERLAEDFQAGRAEVDPKEHACENCGLWALCRIREFENDRG
jgi:ATP-dependent helicase/nuclease subunit B